jgi:small subunit ribosomal protein S16
VVLIFDFDGTDRIIGPLSTGPAGGAAAVNPHVIERDFGMAVRIRLTRYGKRNRPYFRIAVFDSRTRRDGRYLESLGGYDPIVKDIKKKVNINVERLQFWMGNGALPTEKLEKLLLHCGVPMLKKAKPAKSAAKPAKKK